MKKIWNKFCEEESGQGMVEYGLIIALISVALIAVLTGMKNTLRATFTKVDTELSSANSAT